MGVYPRAGGGTLRSAEALELTPRNRHDAVEQPRVYPRAGGGTKTRERASRWLADVGLSPRGRGNHDLIASTFVNNLGSIPARAGEPSTT